MYLYDDILLSAIGNLNTLVLNKSFTKLIKNDAEILPANDYIPKIWEHKWFNNDTIAGYSKGDVVWKHTMTSADFLSSYNEVIYDYANANQILNGYLKYPKGEYNKTPEETYRYLNIISGYSIEEKNGDDVIYVQKLPMLFDYGPLTSDTLPKIEIYVSLKNNNKDYLSNTASWTNIVLSDDNAFNEYISTEISLLLDSHIRDYHLDGINTNEGFSNVLLKRDFSNFELSSLYNALKMTGHNDYINSLGFDFVKIFKKSSLSIELAGSKTLYKWCRLWNSGHLEHGGIIQVPSYDILSSNETSCYTISIDLTWPNDDLLLYDYSESNSNFYGDNSNNLYFSNNAILENYNNSHDLTYFNRYTISLTPVQFSRSDLDGHNINTSQMSSINYPIEANQDKNKTYINFEVHSITNTSFCISRSRTDNLLNNDVKYVLYYTSGYRST